MIKANTWNDQDGSMLCCPTNCSTFYSRLESLSDWEEEAFDGGLTCPRSLQVDEGWFP